jgi:hypothetical protein
MIAYLSANNLPNTAAALRAELSLGDDVFDAATAKKYETLLEKKWTSIVRLQKKVCLYCDTPFCLSYLPTTFRAMSNQLSITDNGSRVPNRSIAI